MFAAADAAIEHFKGSPLPNAVREVIQNSLDNAAPDRGNPVKVVFEHTYIDTKDFGGRERERERAGLANHLQESWEYLKGTGYSNLDKARWMESGVRMLEEKLIPCLKITETGVTGLLEKNWEALVDIEGGAVKHTTNPGGSFGIGKTALFALSGIRTIIYSTLYVNLQEGGRVEKATGKSRLVTHPDPVNGDMLQHIGFWRKPGRQPLKGREIPDAFRLDEPGSSGFFVLGWEPPQDWQNQVAAAAAENFFAAIHRQKLVVETRQDNDPGAVVDYQTLDHRFPESPRKKFYESLVQIEPVDHRLPEPFPVDLTNGLATEVSLKIYPHGEGSSKGVAVINRHGMLITDATDHRYNPFCVRGSTGWPPFTMLIEPALDSDKWLRGLENPAHNGYDLERSCPPNELKKMKTMFQNYRRNLRDLINSKLGAEKTEIVNVDSLRHLLPDVMPSGSGRQRSILESPLQPPNYRNPDPESTEAEIDPEGEGTMEDEPVDPPPDPPDTPKADAEGPGDVLKENTDVSAPHRPPALRRPRVVSASGAEIVVSFDVESNEAADRVRVVIRPQGDKRRREKPLHITAAQVVMGKETVNGAEAVEGAAVLSLAPAAGRGQRAAVRIEVDEPSVKVLTAAPAYIVESL